MRTRYVIPSAVALCLLASCETVSKGKLIGVWPTCWKPEEVDKANAAANRRDWVEWRTMKCGLLGDIGTPVRVIRCAADVTPVRMKHFSRPVPRDANLPDRICEVEAFEDDGSSGIYYTYYFNIEISP